MKKTKVIIVRFISLIAILFCGLYFFQEKAIFHPTKLPVNYQFDFPGKYQEWNVITDDNVELSGLLFKTPQTPKGAVLFLHGNGGTLERWGTVAPLYTSLGYDVYLLDYRGYGKSEGEISSEEQLFSDVQAAYNQLLTRYNESSVVIVGYSIGTGLASYLAAKNNPSRLVLLAPYYSLKELVKDKYPLLPGFVLKYPLRTNDFLKDVNVPILICHGKEDKLIPIESSLELANEFPDKINHISINGLGHGGFHDNEEYIKKLPEFLGQ